MSFKIIWKNEEIESEVETKQEANYLVKEYSLAFGCSSSCFQVVRE
jgi:hypothetical protein